jgi:hypothetical protein
VCPRFLFPRRFSFCFPFFPESSSPTPPRSPFRLLPRVSRFNQPPQSFFPGILPLRRRPHPTASSLHRYHRAARAPCIVIDPARPHRLHPILLQCSSTGLPPGRIRLDPIGRRSHPAARAPAPVVDPSPPRCPPHHPTSVPLSFRCRSSPPTPPSPPPHPLPSGPARGPNSYVAVHPLLSHCR